MYTEEQLIKAIYPSMEKLDRNGMLSIGASIMQAEDGSTEIMLMARLKGMEGLQEVSFIFPFVELKKYFFTIEDASLYVTAGVFRIMASITFMHAPNAAVGIAKASDLRES